MTSLMMDQLRLTTINERLRILQAQFDVLANCTAKTEIGAEIIDWRRHRLELMNKLRKEVI